MFESRRETHFNGGKEGPSDVLEAFRSSTIAIEYCTLVISLKFEPDPIRFGHVEKFKFAPYAVDLLDSFYRVQN